MAQSYTRQSTFADGDTITASLFNNEYDQLVNSFSYSSTNETITGHRHDGTAGQGGNIPQIGDLDFNNKIVVDAANNRWGVYVEVGGVATEQIRVQDGAIVPVTTNDIDLGTGSLQFKDLFIDGTASIDSLTLASGSTVTVILDEDDLVTNSDTALATQQSIKAYVDAQLTAQDFDFSADSGGALSIDLDSESMTFTGGTGIDTSGAGNVVTFAIDSTVATLADVQTLTNKTIDAASNTLSNIANASLTNSTVAYGGVQLSLGGSDATPAFNLVDATGYLGDSSLVTVGALNAGSITAGFGTIDTGASDITTTGIVSGTTLTGTLSTAAQANVTSLGALTSLTVTGDLTVDTSTLKVNSSTNRVGILNTSPDVTLDIGSATDAVHVPVGSTAQRPGTPAAGYFRYNADLEQFEGYTDTWGAIGGGGTNTFTYDTYTGDGATTNFVLSQATNLEGNLIVFIDGVFQTQDAYTISTASGITTLIFSTAPADTRKIVVYTIAAGVSGNNLNLDSFSGDGVLTDFTLSINAVSENNTQVYIDGVYQQKDGYTVTNTTLSFSAPPLNGSTIEVMTFTQSEVNVPVDNTITSAKLSGDLVTPGNLDVTGTVTADGATIDGSLDLNSNSFKHTALTPSYNLIESDIVGENTQFLQASGTLRIRTVDDSVLNPVERLRIDHGTGDISFYSSDGSSQALFWDASAESLGIGTSSPQTSLSIETSGTQDVVSPVVTGQTAGVTYGGLYTVRDGAGDQRGLAVQVYTANVGLNEAMRITSAGSIQIPNQDAINELEFTGTEYTNIYSTTTSGMDVGTTGSGFLRLLTNNTERLRIDSIGNVGIGVTPSAWAASSDALQVGVYANLSRNDALGAGDLSYNAYITNAASDSWNRIIANASTRIHQRDGSIQFKYAASGTAGSAITWSEAMRIDASGNLLVGLSSGQDALIHAQAPKTTYTDYATVFAGGTDSHNGDHAISLMTSGNSLSGIIGSNLSIDGTAFSQPETARSSGYISFSNITTAGKTSAITFGGLTKGTTTALPKMTLDGDGNLLVGTTTSTMTTGGTMVAGGGAGYLIQSHDVGVASGQWYSIFKHGASVIGSITQSGTTAVLYNTSSDQRLKDNIVDAPSASDDIDAIQVRSFDWKVDGSHQKYGMVAQELQTVAPEAVSASEDPDEMMGVDYSKLVPMMLKEIQSLRARVAQLES